MDIFKDFTLVWWQVGLFKLALLSLGVVIGATWPEIFRRWRATLLILFVVLAIYLVYVWWGQ